MTATVETDPSGRSLELSSIGTGSLIEATGASAHVSLRGGVELTR